MSVASIQHFLDDSGNVTSWPSKKSYQFLIIEYLSSFFESDVIYSEADVNQILKDHHTFSDWPLLRRELVEKGFLARDRGGYKYWKEK